ncbi:unnamed protein product [Ceutorhynchus assimilis]|uniref:Peroxisomal membrane protein PEX14 n=1 Tax=Ceutorhynchus assimilis TaxID=467358 RepID=A0A9N9MEY5_9CUCU|nr:unnamed protein product [Ceutorhynchus assimilis]
MEQNNDQEPHENVSQSPSIREDLIDTAIKFLQNPKVIASPLSQKQTFLQKRGLTEDEIRIACERSGAYDHDKQQIIPPEMPPPLSQNMLASYNQYGQMRLSLFDRITDIIHRVAMFSIVAYLIKKIYDTYIAPFLFGTKTKSIEDKIESLEKNIEGAMKDIKSSLGEVKAEVDKIKFTSENELASELKGLESDIATVKGLLLTRKQFPSVTNPIVPPSIPAWQLSSVHQENEGENEEHKEELLEVGSGSGSSEPEHFMKTSESSLEIIYSSKDCDTESCHSKKSSREGNLTD